MNAERRPGQTETANTETTNPSRDLNRPAASGDRTAAIVAGAFARSWEMLAAARRDLALIERHRRQGA